MCQRTLEYAIVVAAEVTSGTGSLSREPVTVATLRSGAGDRVVRLVGGPTEHGGLTRMAGYVIPVAGARVRVDLREERHPTAPTSPGWSWAPNIPAGTWDPTKLPLTFDLALPPSRDLGERAYGELEVAARTWGRPACTGFKARFGAVKLGLIPGDDGTNGVFFHDDAWPAELEAGALAQTILHEDRNGKLRDADIHVNSAAFRFSADGAAGTQDIRGVLVHEIGHALGLGHSSEPRATMNLSGSGLRWRSLEKDDIEGVCSLYPGTGSVGCDVDPCPSGFICVAGACQRPSEREDVCSPCSPDVGGCEAAGDDARCIEVGAGANAGTICGRSCVTDRDCGSGFACRPTTEAGDLQCVSLDGCKNGANLCTTDANCTHSNAVCRDGVCIVPSPVSMADAGVTDATTDPHRPSGVAGGGGDDCTCRAGPLVHGDERWVAAIAAAALLAVRRARRAGRAN